MIVIPLVKFTTPAIQKRFPTLYSTTYMYIYAIAFVRLIVRGLSMNEHEYNASELRFIEVAINVKGILCIANEECFSVEG